MNKTHWKKLHNPDYLGAYSLDPGKDKILTIKDVRNEIITGADGKKGRMHCCEIYGARKANDFKCHKFKNYK